MNLTCQFKTDCDCGLNPITGYSSEVDDALAFVGVGYANPRMPLGAGWNCFGGRAVVSSWASQEDADAAAYLQAILDVENQVACGGVTTPVPPVPPSPPPAGVILGEQGGDFIGAEDGQFIIEE
jgi:hypothetical protein